MKSSTWHHQQIMMVALGSQHKKAGKKMQNLEFVITLSSQPY